MYGLKFAAYAWLQVNCMETCFPFIEAFLRPEAWGITVRKKSAKIENSINIYSWRGVKPLYH